MSLKPTNLRDDVARLIADGYEVSIEHSHLVMHNVPYVTASKTVKLGMLVSTLDGSYTDTVRPSDHVIMFGGEYPCDKTGQPLENIRNASKNENIANQWTINHRFSSKPKRGHYVDYYEKMTTYAAILSNHAAAIDPDCTPRTHRVIEAADDSPFVYYDNASSRAGISAVSQKLTKRSIAIVGLGGTGSYLLDFVAKTPVDEIHLFDGDVFEQHCAFRAPGAASIDQLRERLLKVDYFASIYQSMHRGIVSHGEYITPDNVDALRGHDMVFICIDDNEPKTTIISALEAYDSKFIDVGMGVNLVNDSLIAMLRTTTSTPDHRNHVHERKRIPMNESANNNEYDHNIQVSELNAMNACFAVIQWKQECGFYRDTERELFTVFSLSSNHVLNEDAA